MEWPEKVSLSRCHLSKNLKEEERKPCRHLGEERSRKQSGECKGPEADMCLACLRNRAWQTGKGVSKADDPDT